MAIKVETELIDDLDGGPADETVRFGVNGQMYEIDLSAANKSRFDAVLGLWIDAARRTQMPMPQPPRTLADRRRSAAIRQWAVEAGLMNATTAHGRLRADVVLRYAQAHAKGK